MVTMVTIECASYIPEKNVRDIMFLPPSRRPPPRPQSSPLP
jgi:hypothetical protein